MPPVRVSRLIAVSVVGALAFLIATNPVVVEAARQISGQQIKNNTVTGKDLKNGSLTGKDNLVRLAAAATDDVEISGETSPTAAISVVIKAPAKGFLMIDASVDVLNDDADDTATCQVWVDGTYVRGSIRYLDLSAVHSEGVCATGAPWRVGPGRHVVALVGDTDSMDTLFIAPSLQVLFVPFGADGRSPH